MGFVELEMTNLRELYKTLDATVIQFRVATVDPSRSKGQSMDISES